MMVFVCSSPVQVMRAVHMKMRMDEFRSDADIYITHNCAGYEKISESLKHTELFKDVYSPDIASLGRRILFKLLFRNNRYSRILRNKKYSKLVAFNIEGELTQALFNINRRNDGFEYHCVEDCPNAYPIYEPPAYQWNHPYRWIHIDRQAFHITAWWSSCPELITVPDNFGAQVKKLPIVDINDKEYIKTINKVFGYIASEELDDTDVLIMDEAFYQDGIMIDNADAMLYHRIKEHYPGKKISMKLHPRTRGNRYLDTFDITGVSQFPWELYVLNREYKEKKPMIQIGIACGTLTSDRLMYGVEGQKIVLAPMFRNKLKVPANGTPLITEKRIADFEKIKTDYRNPSNFVVAYSEKEVFEALDGMLSRNEHLGAD